eukprot:TRINITY_DN14620_c0_g1_i10.p1 TRINITY_DN14620_c0_g1~~TRINITY_DN14620_c0_g1_i10.p1  ORF type:complete len:318 (-),score=129.50 TRINITY_DN14620_c0_g1_i10:410-1363(-)
MLRSLVGSEMCIRDRSETDMLDGKARAAEARERKAVSEMEDPSGQVYALEAELRDLTRDSQRDLDLIKMKKESCDSQIEEMEKQRQAVMEETKLLREERVRNDHEATKLQLQNEQLHQDELSDITRQKFKTEADIDAIKRAQAEADHAASIGVEQVKMDHQLAMGKLANELHMEEERLKGCHDQASVIEEDIARLQRATLARAADKKEAIDKKQAKHDFNLQDQRDRAEAQAERIKTLRELPEMIQTYKETEDQAVKLEFDTMQTEQETAEIRRSQYLAASNHKERLFFLEKDLERARSNNFRVSNRIAYSLRNPMF